MATWDAFSTFNVFPDSDLLHQFVGKKDLTCLGIAKSTKHRCGRRIGKQNRDEAARILCNLGRNYNPLAIPVTDTIIDDLASILHCVYHASDASTCATGWRHSLQDLPQQRIIWSTNIIPIERPRTSLLVDAHLATWDPFRLLGVSPDDQFHCAHVIRCMYPVAKDSREAAKDALQALSRAEWNTHRGIGTLQEVARLLLCKGRHNTSADVEDLVRNWESKLMAELPMHPGEPPILLPTTALPALNTGVATTEASISVLSTPSRETSTVISHGLPTPPTLGPNEDSSELMLGSAAIEQASHGPFMAESVEFTFQPPIPQTQFLNPFCSTASGQQPFAPQPTSFTFDLTPPQSLQPTPEPRHEPAVHPVPSTEQVALHLPSPASEDPFTHPRPEALPSDGAPTRYSLIVPALQDRPVSGPSSASGPGTSVDQGLQRPTTPSPDVSAASLSLAGTNGGESSTHPVTPTRMPRQQAPAEGDFGHVTITPKTYVYKTRAQAVRQIEPARPAAVEYAVQPLMTSRSPIDRRASVPFDDVLATSSIERVDIQIEKPTMAKTKQPWYQRVLRLFCCA